MLQLLSLLFLFQTTEVPLRSNEDFQIELKYDLKQRPSRDINSVDFEKKRAVSVGMLPYLVVLIKIKNVQPNEVKFKCETDKKMVFVRKAAKSGSMRLDMGFLEDMKDRVTPYEYTVFALGADRKPINQIHFEITKTGTFLVNGEKRGQF